MKLGKIAMIGTVLAKEGQEFTYVGPALECEDCKFSKVCQNLERGKKYRICGVRRIQHDCPIHEGGKVTVVEVEEAPLEVSIPERKALEGALVTLDEEECPLAWCKNHRFCRRKVFDGVMKVSIVEIKEKLDCPRELKLKRSIVELQ